MVNQKSKITAGFLALFFGFIGAHDVYLGNWKKFIIRIILNSLAFISLVIYTADTFNSIFAPFGAIVDAPEPNMWLAHLTGILFYAIPISFTWAFVEAILIFAGVIAKDGKGNPIGNPRGLEKPPQLVCIPSTEADELAKFKNLLDNGTITQDEFDAKKKQLLGI